MKLRVFQWYFFMGITPEISFLQDFRIVLQFDETSDKQRPKVLNNFYLRQASISFAFLDLVYKVTVQVLPTIF